MNAVGLESVTIDFGDTSTALNAATLHVDHGEIMALVGPSGSGKTTLLRAVAGFLTPTAGEVILNGEVVSTPSVHRPVQHRGLGMVFQQHALWPHMTVEENIAYPLKLAGVLRAERRQRVRDLLEMLELPGMQGRRPHQLSGGQRQRVAVARAIVHRPDVLLLDEALSALDEPLRADLRVQLKMMAKQLDLTVLHVTHDRSEAMAIADRIAVLNRGEIEQVATPGELIHSPTSAFVAEFMLDATVLSGHMTPQGFTADHIDLSLEPETLHRLPDASLSMNSEHVRGVLALPPGALSVRTDASGSLHGVVISSEYGRHAHALTVDVDGLTLRAEALEGQPRLGETVTLQPTAGYFFEEAAQSLLRSGN